MKKQNNLIIWFSFNIKKIKDNKNHEDLLKSCKYLYFKLSNEIKCDLNCVHLNNEIMTVKSLYWKKIAAQRKYYHLLMITNCTLPNLWVALRIMMIIPVMTAICEKSFSKLKLIKTHLRNQHRQNNVSTILH